MSRTVRAAACAGAAGLLLAGCGGERRSADPGPRLPRTLAGRLAARSDAVATALRAGETCRAATHARRLQSEVVAAINAGRVGPAFQEDLQSAVNDLVDRVRCAEPEPAPASPAVSQPRPRAQSPEGHRDARPEKAKKEHGKAKGNGKGKGRKR